MGTVENIYPKWKQRSHVKYKDVYDMCITISSSGCIFPLTTLHQTKINLLCVAIQYWTYQWCKITKMYNDFKCSGWIIYREKHSDVEETCKTPVLPYQLGESSDEVLPISSGFFGFLPRILTFIVNLTSFHYSFCRYMNVKGGYTVTLQIPH